MTDTRLQSVVATDAGDPSGRTLFRQPPHAFRPAAYWFWHSIPDEGLMRAQLADFLAQGFGTILIQTRIAFDRNLYMRPAYLSAYRQAVVIMAELDLKAGIYDDYNWISGQAAGLTVAGHDHLRERHLFWATGESRDGEIDDINAAFTESMGPDILDWQYDGGRVLWCEWQIQAALLHPEGAVDELAAIVDVTADVEIVDSSDGACRYRFSGSLAAGQQLTVFVSARSLTSRLINYLLPEAAERFIAVGLDPYAKALDGLMPDPLGFLFYDQPAAGFYSWRQRHGALGNSLLFADTLPAAVGTTTNLPFPTVLLSLLRDIGDGTDHSRASFYAAYSRLMNSAFFGTLKAWAERVGIVLTGHEILPHIGSWPLNGGFTSIDPRVAPAVDFFGIDAFRHATAVDSNNFTAQLAPKIGDSVARANGRSRCVVETYATAVRTPVRAAGQWELTLETMRAQAIRLYCLGARQFLWHGLYQTDGHGDDGTIFTNPRFDFAPGINFEPWWPYHALFAAETARLSAFLEPAVPCTPVAIVYPLETAWAKGPRHSHAAHIGAWCEHLTALNCGFMLVREDDLTKGRIADGKIHAAGLAFDAVVMPSAVCLESGAILDTLAAFEEAGGAVWFSGELPAASRDEMLTLDAATVTVHLPDLPALGDIESLVARLPQPAPGIIGGAGRLPWQWTGRDPDGSWRVLLFNDGVETVACDIRLGAGFDCEAWDAASGDIEAHAGLMAISLALEPHAVCCLTLKAGTQPGSRTLSLPLVPVLDESHAIPLDGGWTLAIDGHERAISVETGWHTQGLAHYSGEGCYSCSFSLPDGGSFILDLPGVETAATVRLDGVDIGRRAWRPYRFAVDDLAAGQHRLEVLVSNTAANRYYAGTPYQGDSIDAGGLTAVPRLVPYANTSPRT
jgi:hypothetical protein